ncbi:MAG: hypothetical protein ACD_59C00053G0006 [uncultured bacterium]|nr:MAG: hypothetical protein ACD_59C00053G0006 [uncultured bacterium]
MELLMKTVIELMKAITQFVRFQMRVECKSCGRSYSRETLNYTNEFECKCGQKIFY